MPLMNLFIVLIPLLLLSAVFVQVTVIDMNLPASETQQEPPPAAPLELAVRIQASGYVVSGRGIASRTIAKEQTANATQDAARLQLAAALEEIAGAHPDNQEVRIVAEATTKYEEIITVMDIARAAGLPQAALADANMGAF